MKYGLLKAKIEHRCKLPARYFTPYNSLFRCECGAVYRLTADLSGIMPYWNKVNDEEWVKAGGEL